MRRIAVLAKRARVTPCSHNNTAVNRQLTRLRLGSRIRITCEHEWIHCSRASMFPSRSVRPHGANACQHLLLRQTGESLSASITPVIHPRHHGELFSDGRRQRARQRSVQEAAVP
jgi:hypothetical protein